MDYLEIYGFSSVYSKRGEEGRRRTMDTKALGHDGLEEIF